MEPWAPILITDFLGPFFRQRGQEFGVSPVGVFFWEVIVFDGMVVFLLGKNTCLL